MPFDIFNIFIRNMDAKISIKYDHKVSSQSFLLNDLLSIFKFTNEYLKV
jgi:hypothetical protein